MTNTKLLSFSLIASACTFSSPATVLFDFDSVPGQGSPTTQAGWTTAPSGNGTDGTVTVATTAIGSVTVDGRTRGDNGGGAEAAMWGDFVFANGSFSSNPGSGLSISITGLMPSTTYPIIIWGWDDSSNPNPTGVNRSADWSGGGGSGTLTFPGGPDPTSLSDYNVSFDATTDATGALTLTGVVAASSPSASHNVFINGLEIGDAIPEPSSALFGLLGFGFLAFRRR